MFGLVSKKRKRKQQNLIETHESLLIFEFYHNFVDHLNDKRTIDRILNSLTILKNNKRDNVSVNYDLFLFLATQDEQVNEEFLKRCKFFPFDICEIRVNMPIDLIISVFNSIKKTIMDNEQL